MKTRAFHQLDLEPIEPIEMEAPIRFPIEVLLEVIDYSLMTISDSRCANRMCWAMVNIANDCQPLIKTLAEDHY